MKTNPDKPVEVETVAVPFGERDIFAPLRQQLERRAAEGNAYEIRELDRYLLAVTQHGETVIGIAKALNQIRALWAMQPLRTKERDQLEATFLSILVMYLRNLEATYANLVEVSHDAQQNLNAHRAKGQ